MATVAAFWTWETGPKVDFSYYLNIKYRSQTLVVVVLRNIMVWNGQRKLRKVEHLKGLSWQKKRISGGVGAMYLREIQRDSVCGSRQV